MEYLQYGEGYSGQMVDEFSGEGNGELAMVSTLALVAEEDQDMSASDESTNYNGQIVDEFSGEGDGGLQSVDEFSGGGDGGRPVALVTKGDPNVSASGSNVEGGQGMSAPSLSMDDLLELPGPQFEKCLRDLSGPDISLAKMMELPVAEFDKCVQWSVRIN
jgi:hypothetical protein